VTSFHRINPAHGYVVAGERWRYGPSAGTEFIDESNGGPGARLRKPSRKKT
jgi:hypothetical protein